MALPPRTRPNCRLAPPLSPRSIASLLGPPAWDSAKLQLGSSLTSKMHRLAAWPSYLGLEQTSDWLLPYLQGATLHYLALPPGTRPNFSMAYSLPPPRVSSSCLALPPGTRPYCSLASPLPPRSIGSVLGPPTCDSTKLKFVPPTWDSAKLQLGSFLTSKKHRRAAWPSHLGLGQTSAWLLLYLQGASPRCLALPTGTRLYSWLLPYLQGASPHCLALQPGTRPNCSLSPPLPLRSIASLLGLTSWDSTKLQLGSSLTSKEHRLAVCPSHLGLSQTTAWLLPYLQGESPRCLALRPGTRPNYSLAPPLRPRSIASLLDLPTWDSTKLQLGSFLTSKELRLVDWPSFLGLGQTAAWLLPYI
ncbi:hypothetical protein Adt_35078 [Abeliophyllum distichum]|uniref:Uncharacterized protein n=1 Tax=Abeliophyllum distichum TaxID=126358 RepID=A0ABD1QDP9_9LAMI